MAIKKKHKKTPFINPRVISYLFEKIRKVAVFVLIIVGVLWAGSWFILGGYFDQFKKHISNSYYEATASMGFIVKDVIIEGRVNTDPDVLTSILNIERGDPIFSINPNRIDTLIERVSWVEHANIERQLPSKLFIRLSERKPVALWKDKATNKTHIIDRHGVLLTSYDIKQYDVSLMLYGEEGRDHIDDILTMLETYPDIYKRTKAVAYIGKRRWDLIMDNDVRIKLPEDDISLAMATLSKVEEEDNLLNRNLTEIDVRTPGRLVLKTHRGHVKDLIPTINE